MTTHSHPSTAAGAAATAAASSAASPAAPAAFSAAARAAVGAGGAPAAVGRAPLQALAQRIEQAVSEGLDRWTRELCTPPADAGAIEYASWLRLLRRVGP